MVSMFDFHRSDRGSNPSRQPNVSSLSSANGYQFNYWDQILETEGEGVAPPPPPPPPFSLVEANEKGAFGSPSSSVVQI